MAKTRILVVEDDSIICNLVELMLRKLDYAVVGGVSSGEEAIACVAEAQPDLVLMDVNLDGKLDGIETGTFLYTIFNIPVVFLTGSIDNETIQRAKVAEPFGYLTKPFTKDEIYSTIEIALNNFRVNRSAKGGNERDLRGLMHADEGIVITDAKGEVLFLNPSAENLTGWKRQHAVMRPLKEVLHVHDQSGLAGGAFIDKAVREALIVGVERVGTLTSRGGKQRIVRMKFSPVRGRSGNVVSLITSMQQQFSGPLGASSARASGV
ncbi:response regulator [Methanoculleus sp. FWC-SCC1]|uniref:Response regulator n=1 Tax=Methanoculleus frigidifontis TaxID=2584085 RepID=A0ABT8MBQ3_9EURY|nr:response regulator [Methanoculleus sp. FWC-SCC1]MDN7025321.1 response regulator [Methanoculleus sp. FWC-SCC1]